MARIWLTALGFAVSFIVLVLLGPLGGVDLLITAGVPIGAGLVAPFLVGGGYLVRGVWLFVGPLLAALGFALTAMMMPDTPNGIAAGSIIPVLLLALLTMWSRQITYFLVGLMGMGAMTGVFAVRMDADPQALNVSLPIALGWCLLPLGLAYLFGMLVRTFTKDSGTEQPEASDEPANPAPELQNAEA